MRATVMFNGSLYTGELVRETKTRILVKFTTGSAMNHECWFRKVTRPIGRLVSRRVTVRPGEVALEAASGFIHVTHEEAQPWTS